MDERMFGVWKNQIQCSHITLLFKQRWCCKVLQLCIPFFGSSSGRLGSSRCAQGWGRQWPIRTCTHSCFHIAALELDEMHLDMECIHYVFCCFDNVSVMNWRKQYLVSHQRGVYKQCFQLSALVAWFTDFSHPVSDFSSKKHLETTFWINLSFFL